MARMTQVPDDMADAWRLQWYFRLCPLVFVFTVLVFLGFPAEFNSSRFRNRIKLPGKVPVASDNLLLAEDDNDLVAFDETKLPALGTPEYVLRHVKPRAYDFYPASEFCFKPDRHHSDTLKTGLLFAKPKKVGGSTAAGVHIRIARNIADRQGKDFAFCKSRWHHGLTSKVYKDRNNSQSLMWTLFRDPTSREISQFYHFRVSRRGTKPTLQNFLQYVGNTTHFRYMEQGSSLEGKVGADPVKHVKSVLYDNDFIGITERFDETLVALSFLWGLPLADILYLSAKRHGGYDGGGEGCTLIQSPTEEERAALKEGTSTKEFQKIVEWDNLVYSLANKSLDMTIKAIGRTKFDKVLSRYQQAQKLASEKCSDETMFPCTDGGKGGGEKYKLPETDCLDGDMGCGYACLDDVATELGLWEPLGELEYRYPGAFGLGAASRTRLRKRLEKLGSPYANATVKKWPSGH